MEFIESPHSCPVLAVLATVFLPVLLPLLGSEVSAAYDTLFRIHLVDVEGLLSLWGGCGLELDLASLNIGPKLLDCV